MTKNSINAKLRTFAKTLSPTDQERKDINTIYSSIRELLGATNCVQIGSYPRYTSITPVHDLDILFCLGQWSEQQHNPQHALNELLAKIQNEYKNDTGYSVSTSLQNHSVTMVFKDPQEEKFSIDIVPCYSFSVNKYGDAMYMVPEIVKEKNHALRHQKPWDPEDEKQWIKSDPRGYISQAAEVGQNSDFRKAVKIVKFWTRSLRENINDDLKLKPFHVEQVITEKLKSNPEVDLLGILFEFFCELPDIVNSPNRIEDRARPGKYIDSYLEDLTDQQKQIIEQVRDNVLISLEEITEESSAEQIFTAKTYRRNPNEQFMFDFNVIVCCDTNDQKLDISYDQQDAIETRRMRRQRQRRQLPRKRELHFKIIEGNDPSLHYFWKVQNSPLLDNPDHRRGEITEGQTKNNPEHTEYVGEHYVECFAVNNQDKCTQRARCDVIIGEG